MGMPGTPVSPGSEFAASILAECLLPAVNLFFPWKNFNTKQADLNPSPLFHVGVWAHHTP